MSEINWANIIPSHEEMLAAGLHYGRKKSVRHPKMEPFLHGLRDSIHIINVFKTEEELKKAIEFLKKTRDEGGLILWAALNSHSEGKIKEIADLTGTPYIKERWLGGTMTNFKTIQERIKHYKDVSEKWENREKGDLTKKERHELSHELKLLKDKFEGLERLSKVPDVLFLASLRNGNLPLREAKRLGVKIVAICNTESDPTSVDYPIPANDNARQSVELILETIKKAL